MIFENGRILFFIAPEPNNLQSSVMAQKRRNSLILFDTCDETIWPIPFSQSALEKIWSVSLKRIKGEHFNKCNKLINKLPKINKLLQTA